MVPQMPYLRTESGQVSRDIWVHATFMRDDTGFMLVWWIVELQRHKALARARFQVFEHTLVARIVRQDQQKILMGIENHTTFLHGENTPMIRQRMNEHGG